jgi:hypothetical protein
VDTPNVVLERLEAGARLPVTTRTGRVVDESRPDILLAHTPTPLEPSSAPQTHQYWAAWQAVAPWDERAGLPLGTYRLRVTGRAWAGTARSWPWDTEPYEVLSEEFEVVPAAITVRVEGEALYASLVAPAHGWRLVDLDGDAAGDNPVPGPLTVVLETAEASEELVVEPVVEGSRSLLPVALPAGWISIEVTDPYGNRGAYGP